MPTFEEEALRLRKATMRLSNFSLLNKRIDIRGAENFVREGPNIIVGNHIGSYKDVALLFKTVPRQIFFTANEMLFDREAFSWLVRNHLDRHLGRFGSFIHLLFNPFYSYVVRFISTNIAKVGSIPVNLCGRRAEAVRRCQDYLRVGRAVIALQGRGRVDGRDPNPYVKPFRKGPAVMSYNLLVEDGISVPVTPLSIFGAHIMFLVPARIKVNVGAPMFIRDYMGGSMQESIERFRDALNARVEALFRESLKF
ncbi:MAG: 1-acyl-sn-glycerol-3-phosphate acyltransferase [Candidatus Aminicenantes bacterium]|nr:1-acyl-sn-glycerol-3-phosphate acyltransferase [Candidatus Aminicenantes bacterium]